MFGTTKRLRSMPFNLHFLTTLHFYVFVFLCSDGQEIVPRSFGQIKKIGRVSSVAHLFHRTEDEFPIKNQFDS